MITFNFTQLTRIKGIGFCIRKLTWKGWRYLVLETPFKTVKWIAKPNFKGNLWTMSTLDEQLAKTIYESLRQNKKK